MKIMYFCAGFNLGAVFIDAILGHWNGAAISTVAFIMCIPGMLYGSEYN